METIFIFLKEIEKPFLLHLIKHQQQTLQTTPHRLPPSIPPQDLQDNLSLISNGIDILDRFIHATLFNLTQKSTTEKKIWPTTSSKRKIWKILETLQHTIYILRTELVHK